MTLVPLEGGPTKSVDFFKGHINMQDMRMDHSFVGYEGEVYGSIICRRKFSSRNMGGLHCNLCNDLINYCQSLQQAA